MIQNNKVTYTQSELNKMEIINLIKSNTISVEIVAHLHGYHSGFRLEHISELDDEEMECFNRYHEKENYGLWSDDYVLIYLDSYYSDEYQYDFEIMGVVEWFEMEFEDEDRKKELLSFILDKDDEDDEELL